MRHLLVLAITLAGGLAAGCKDAAKGAAPTAPNFELACESSDTATASELFCVRTDTRSGDILRVTYGQLPTSNGPTAVGDGPAGRFTTVCDSTSTDTRSDFYCIRMNTETGEMLLVNLQKVAAIPAAK
jgi:hypothetical protein